VGTADDILDRPATPFVASFVGEAVRLSVEGAHGTIRLGPHSLPCQGQQMVGPAELYVRPRDLVLADGAIEGIPARVVAVRRTGPARRAELSFAEALPPVEIELPLSHPIAKGDVISVRFTALRLFPSR
jgi:sulfate transport system ATP-binding protein